ncbi:unnamed protein product [Thlaspi arvense]|uniref:Bifunctional inhibitor/plant lipid transfer protein/seed storage helical domain-containing protein n=1 Tax=Thlaspi arvense TaxID=13288 RepID=A0AAU9S380_THLAR|nr:unnamed protein product [Thlaspi arvense]
MEGLTLIVVVMSSLMLGVKGQQIISTPCTSSMISTFTPCLNFITGSSGGSVTPTAGCCDSLKSLTNTGMECACLILTANVPLPTGFINRTLSLALPRACKMSGGVPVQCQAAGTPLPAPGPVPFLLAPPPPMSAFSPGSSKAAATARRWRRMLLRMDRWAHSHTKNSTGGSALATHQPRSIFYFSISSLLFSLLALLTLLTL